MLSTIILMKTIQSFIEKHNGNYTQEIVKFVNTFNCKQRSQAKIGSLIYKGSKLKISINEVGGADLFSQPLRIKNFLDKLHFIQEDYPHEI